MKISDQQCNNYLAMEVNAEFSKECLKYITEEGYTILYSKKQSNGKLYYWCPDKDNNSVAWFVADSDRAFLSCGRDPSSTNSSLGVRLALPQGALAQK